jgi:thioredoxin reductase (NADPH)
VAKSVTLIHRRNEFRGALDSVEKVQELKNAGKINLITPAEVIGLKGDGHIEAITVDKEGEVYDLATDYFIPLFAKCFKSISFFLPCKIVLNNTF